MCINSVGQFIEPFLFLWFTYCRCQNIVSGTSLFPSPSSAVCNNTSEVFQKTAKRQYSARFSPTKKVIRTTYIALIPSAIAIYVSIIHRVRQSRTAWPGCRQPAFSTPAWTYRLKSVNRSSHWERVVLTFRATWRQANGSSVRRTSPCQLECQSAWKWRNFTSCSCTATRWRPCRTSTTIQLLLI